MARTKAAARKCSNNKPRNGASLGIHKVRADPENIRSTYAASATSPDAHYEKLAKKLARLDLKFKRPSEKSQLLKSKVIQSEKKLKRCGEALERYRQKAQRTKQDLSSHKNDIQDFLAELRGNDTQSFLEESEAEENVSEDDSTRMETRIASEHEDVESERLNGRTR